MPASLMMQAKCLICVWKKQIQPISGRPNLYGTDFASKINDSASSPDTNEGCRGCGPFHISYMLFHRLTGHVPVFYCCRAAIFSFFSDNILTSFKARLLY